MPKFVIIDSHVEFPTATDRSDQFSSFNAEAVRAEVEASVFGDRVEKVAKGVYTNTLNANVRPDADFVFLLYLLQQQDLETDTSVLYRPKTGAKATSNPELTFDVCVTKTPPIGGDRGSLLEGNLSLRINSAITYDNGAVTVTLG